VADIWPAPSRAVQPALRELGCAAIERARLARVFPVLALPVGKIVLKFFR